MSKKKACKKCRSFVDKDTCSVCGSTSFSTSWQGRIFIGDVQKSLVAQKVGITAKGEYAIKVR